MVNEPEVTFTAEVDTAYKGCYQKGSTGGLQKVQYSSHKCFSVSRVNI